MSRKKAYKLPKLIWTCRHCGFTHSAADLLRLDGDTFQCKQCGKPFPSGPGKQLGKGAPLEHNHFFWEEPRIYYMHIHGHGKAVDLAKQIKPALDLIGKGAPSQPAAKPASAQATTLDTSKIAKIVGHDGEQNGAVYKITIGRDDMKLKEMGAVINASEIAPFRSN